MGETTAPKPSGDEPKGEDRNNNNLNDNTNEASPQDSTGKTLNKLQQTTVQNVIESVLKEFLQSKQYAAEEAPKWVNEIAQLINARVRGLNYRRYKLISTIVLGEQIGGGIHIGMRCLWDSDTDMYASFTFMTETIYCVGTVCGLVY